MDLKNTTWDNTGVYKDFQDPVIKLDLAAAQQAVAKIRSQTAVFSNALKTIDSATFESLQDTLPLAIELYRLKLDQQIVIGTMMTYARTKLSTHSLSKDAKDLESLTVQVSTQLSQAINPLDLFLLRAPANYLEQFFKDDRVKEMKFYVTHMRERNDFLLTPEAEELLIGHGVDGHHAWGKLYTEMASTIQADVAGMGRMGLAKASSFRFQGNRLLRENAYRAVNAAWTQFQVPAAAVLNAIYGWRIENYGTRSHQRELNYLDVTCHSERISAQTLNSLMSVTYQSRSIGHRGAKILAHEMQIAKPGPWDLLAAYPEKLSTFRPIPLPEAIDLIAEAFSEFSQDMADYAKMAFKKNWIDSEPTEQRQTGAYCTGFARLRESRIFMTYDGSVKNVITLAHELGHAYHNWVMRDIPLFETMYSASIAETASIFAETLVRAALLKKAATTEEKKKILWQEVESAISFLNDIPARFEFEKMLFEKRKLKSLSADELKATMEQAWERWFEDSLSENDEMFWASKMHFHMTRISFYNYPYLFGYLFSLGIYAQKDQHGEGFAKLYVDLLRDSGRMTAEGLIQKYFQQDISQPEFWMNSIKIIEQSIAVYEQIIASELSFLEPEKLNNHQENITKTPHLN